MKKTLITLVAMAGVAAADVSGDWEAIFTSSDASKDQTVDDYSAAFSSADSPLTLEFDSMEITGTAGGGYSADAPGNKNTSAIRPGVNIISGAGTYTLTFTVENTSSEFLKIEAITLNSFGYNNGGDAHNQGGTPVAYYDLSYTLSGEAEAVTIRESANVYSDATVNFSLGSNSIDLGVDESVTFSLKVSKKEGGGSFVGLSGATFKVVPEPATATLSLLALCGLAARRRRH